MKPQVRLAGRTDLPALVDFTLANGQRPEEHCLHSWAGETAQALQEQLLKILEAGELIYLLAGQDGALQGSLGAEFDLGLGRAWLRGPHLAAGQDWQALAPALIARLLAELPAGVSLLSAYLNIENRRAQEFYLAQGFIAGESLNDDYQLKREGRLPSIEHNCTPLAASQSASFDQLFSQLFPNAYYSPARIRAMSGASHRVFVIAADADVLGFAVTCVDEGGSSGEIQFLGVRPDCQQGGFGQRLLFCAIDDLFDRAGVDWIGLNVNRDTPHARRLYERAGFTLRYSGVGLKKQIS
jgi:ribosomal protein S18 acetylase RimI-like enzyme